MSLPFSKEPLKEFLRETSQKRKRSQKEHTVLLIIITAFILGSIIFLNPKLTGMVTYGANAERLVINEQFSKNTSLAFGLKGNLTSVRISGNIFGEGTARIYMNDKLILDSSKIKKSGADQITGFVIFEENQSDNIQVPDEEEETIPPAEIPVMEGSEEIIDENIEERAENEVVGNENTEEGNTEFIGLINVSLQPSENITLPHFENISEELSIIENDSLLYINKSSTNITSINITPSLNTSLSIENETINLADTANETYNQTIEIIVGFENISGTEDETDIPIVEIEINVSENDSILEGLDNTNISANESGLIFSDANTFENYCLETCYLKSIGKNIVIRIEVDNVILNLTELIYTYIEDSNISTNETLINTTLNHSLIEKATLSLNYSHVEINKPVMWKKVVNVSLINKTLLPKDAYNITSEGNAKVKIGQAEYDLDEYNGFAYSRALENEVKRLEKPTKEKEALEIYEKVTSINKKILSLKAQDIDIEKNITLEFESGKEEIEISYYTEGPKLNEDIINDYKKRITISSDVHYENVLTYAEITESKEDSIKVYWIVNETKLEFKELMYIDTNNNSLIDKLQWITPHLSNQTFEISITVLNPYEYLRDGETWIVAFNTTGIGNLTISSPNAGWAEFLTDDENTFDEMQLLNLSCGNQGLLDSLQLIGYDNKVYDFIDLDEDSNIDAKALLIKDYECNSTGYLSNHMIEAGYATLLFEFYNQNRTVSDLAYDPASYVVVELNFSDSTNNKAYLKRDDGSLSQPPAGSSAWNGAEVASYTNITTVDGVGVQTFYRGALTNFEPWIRLNFTITMSSTLISQLNATITFRDNDNTATTEDCKSAYWLASTNTWTSFGNDANANAFVKNNFSVSSSISNYIEGNQFVMLVSGNSHDANEGCTVDYAEVRIRYLNDSLPTHDNPTIAPAIPIDSSNLTCSWVNVADADGDSVINLTAWYKNDVPINALYLPFESSVRSSTNTTDYSGNDNTGTVHGATWSGSSGRVKGGYTFDGNDYIEIPDSSSLYYRNFTIMAWIYPTDLTDGWITLYQQSNIANNWYNVQIYVRAGDAPTANYPVMRIDWDGDINVDANEEVQGNSVLSANRWYHVVGSYNGTAMKFYVNGTLTDTTDVVDTVTNSNRGHSIGVNEIWGEYYTGIIDEFMIFNHSLSDKQVLQYYRDGASQKYNTRLHSAETSIDDQWYCSVTPNDGYLDGTTKNSDAVSIYSNSPPEHGTPYITPSSPSTSSNLTCNWANVIDAEGDRVVNVTNWYRNNKSITVLYMSFEGNGNEESNATDYSGYDMTGTISGAVWNRTGGKIGGAYRFDGSNDRIMINDTGANSIYDFNVTDNITMMAWFKLSEMPSTNEWFTILSKEPNYYLQIGNSFGQDELNMCYIDSGSTLHCYGYNAALGSLLQVGRWHQLAISYTYGYGNKARIYFDGQNYTGSWSTGNGNNVPMITNGPIYISGEPSGEYFNGTIDEVRIFNRTLTPKQINLIFRQENRSMSSRTLYYNETTLDEQWHCSVTPNDGYNDGISKNSTRVTITSMSAPEINYVQCAINTSSNWQNCASALWNDTITQVRVNCTDQNDDINRVKFNLSNIPDVVTKFNSSNATSVSGDLWVYNNADFKISDSGRFNLTVVCYDESSNSDYNLTTWVVPWGVLNSTWVTPTANANISQNSTRTFTSILRCLTGECGRVNVTLDPYIKLNYSHLLADGYCYDTLADLRTVMKWNISGIPSDMSIVSANLSLFICLNANMDADATISRISSQAWTESGLQTACDASSLNSSTAYAFSSTGSGTWTRINVTHLIKTDYSQDMKNATIRIDDLDNPYNSYNAAGDDGALVIGEADADPILVFVDREGSNPSAVCTGNTANRPSLSIYYEELTPEVQSKGKIPMTPGASPFWTPSQNSINCTDMKLGRTCQTTWTVNATADPGNTYEFFVIYNSLDYSAYIESNTTDILNITVDASQQENSVPNITAPILRPIYANTSSNIQCNATADDGEQSSLTVYWYWFNSTAIEFSGTKSVTAGVNTLITTLGAGNTSRDERWNCTVVPYDSSLYGTNKTARIAINNSIPTQGTPTVTPSIPNITSNLTANWISVSDADSDRVKNITNWYRNNKSITVLHMPFEGNGNESKNATDYSGYRNKGTVFGAVFNRTGGKIGGAYLLDGTDDQITVADSPSLDIVGSFSVSAWIRLEELPTASRAVSIISKGDFTSEAAGSNSNYAIFMDNGISGSNICISGGYESSTGTDRYAAWCNSGMAVNRWYHVVAVHDSDLDTVRIYVNGTSRQEATGATEAPDTGSQTIEIGDNLDNAAGIGQYVNGTIDEVMIFNYSLSPEQVWANYQAGLANKTSRVIVRNETAASEQWKCSVTPNDGYQDGETKNSTAVTILESNTAPSRVNLSTPTAGNTTVHRRYTRFTWDAAYDADSDPLNYTLNITSPYCSNLYYGNISSLNFTSQSELCIGNMYFWQVKAYDGTEYGQWSQKWNFTLEPIIVLNLTTNRVNFGNLSNGGIVTTDSNASPLIVQNDGNIRLNISYVSALNSLFSSIGLNTAYFQFKIDNDTTEIGSFNWTASQTSWTNITSIAVQNKSAIAHLKYQDSQDTAEIDIKVIVPTSEGAGRKSAIVYIIGESP